MGYLYLGCYLFGLDDVGLYLDMMLYMGILFVVFVFYKCELWYIICYFFSKFIGFLVMGMIFVVVIGFLFKDYFDSIFKSGLMIGWEFFVIGLLLWFGDFVKNGYKKMDYILYGDVFFIGLF